MAVADVKCIAATRIGGTDIEYAQGMRAGSWLFFTGHMASDFEHGLAAQVAGRPGHPLDSPRRYRREGDFIIARLAQLIAAQGGDLRHIVRVDQYYPDAQVVNAYQRARKAVLKDFVPPSTICRNFSMSGTAISGSLRVRSPSSRRKGSRLSSRSWRSTFSACATAAKPRRKSSITKPRSTCGSVPRRCAQAISCAYRGF